MTPCFHPSKISSSFSMPSFGVLTMTYHRALFVPLVTAMLCGCSLVTTNTVPAQSDVAEIRLSLEPDVCCADRFRITDRDAINRILDSYRSLDDGWRTDKYLALTRGWFTSPSFPNRAVFLNKKGQSIHVLEFSDWMVGARTIPSVGDSDAYRKPSPELLAALRTAPRDPIASKF